MKRLFALGCGCGVFLSVITRSVSDQGNPLKGRVISSVIHVLRLRLPRLRLAMTVLLLLSGLFTVSAYAWQITGGWQGAPTGAGGGTATYNTYYSYTTTAAGDNLTTDNITEGGVNKYWHNYLLYQGLTGKLFTDNVTESAGYLYYTPARANAQVMPLLTGLTTDNITEGATDKYFHNASVFSAITGKLYYDNITESPTVHPFSDTYRNYLNQSVTNTSSPTFVGVTSNATTTGTLYAQGAVNFLSSITTPLSGYMHATPSGIVTAAGLTHADLDDTTITSPAANQVLTYNGSKWVNAAAQGGGGATVTIDNFTIQQTGGGALKIADRIEQNIFLNALRMAANASMSMFNMVDGIVDKFKDTTTLDNVSGSVSSNYVWSLGGYTTSQAVGGADAYSKLLIHADGSGQTFVDSSLSPHTVTANGDVTQSAVQSKFGGKSTYFDGAGDYLTVPDSNDWYFDTVDFTVDFWVYFSSFGTNYLFEQSGGFVINCTATSCQVFLGDSSPLNFTADVTTLSTGQWYHMALVRNVNTWYYFVNGVPKTKTLQGGSYSSAAPNGTGDMKIGGHAGFYHTGYMDEIHISKGIARWTTDFSATLPSSPWGLGGSYTDNMTLVSKPTAALTIPATARFGVLQEQLDPAAVVNTDWKAYVTSDNGTNWNQITLAKEGMYSDNVTMYSGSVNLTGAGTGMRWKIQTWNKLNKLLGVWHVWD
ncbi:MAG: LamG domain-containing protein [Nitrospirae bacterium YQR-1]